MDEKCLKMSYNKATSVLKSELIILAIFHRSRSHKNGMIGNTRASYIAAFSLNDRPSHFLFKLQSSGISRTRFVSKNLMIHIKHDLYFQKK